jgi:O-antigen ligase
MKASLIQFVKKNGWIMALMVLLAALSAVSPLIAFYLAILTILLYSFIDRRILLIFILVFIPISTFPAISDFAARVEIDVLANLKINFMGLVRTSLAGVLFIHAFIILKRHWRTVWPDARWFILFWAYAVFSFFWSPRWAFNEGSHLLVELTFAFSLYVFVLQLAYREDQARMMVKAIFILAIVITIGSLFNFTFLPEISEAGITDLDRGERFIGVAASPNILAGNLAVFISLGLAFLSVPRFSSAWRRKAILVILLSAIPLLLTYSRSGWLGVGLAGASIVWFRRKWNWIVIFLVVGIGVMISPIGGKFLGDWRSAIGGEKLAGVQGFQNAYGRIDYVWLPTIRALETPQGVIVGRGAGGAQAWAFANTGQAMHSEVLQILIDFGLIGMGFLGLGFFFVIRRSLKILRSKSEPFVKALGIGSLAVIASMLPKMAWDHVFNGPSGWLLLMTVSLGVGASRWPRQDAGGGPEISRFDANL